MDRAASAHRGNPLPENGNGSEDLFRLVDDWVHQFDLEPITPPAQNSTATAMPPPRTGDAPKSIAAMRSNWNSRAPGAAPGRRDSSGDSSKAEQGLPLKCAGLVVTFTDAIGGTVSLAHADSAIQHRGAISVRGGSSAIADAAADVGLPAHVSRAFEFIAAWFCHPFDAVNLRVGRERVLSWGFWPVAGGELARCLAEWKAQQPASFAEQCSVFGVDVTEPEPTDGEGGRAALMARLGTRTTRGRAAEWTIASEPTLVAVLARAGRAAEAQKIQVEFALANWVTPILFEPWDAEASAERLIVDVLRSPQSLAVLLYLVRRHGQRAALRLHRSRDLQQAENDETAWIERIVRSLRHMHREHDASEVLRIASSPELMG